MTSLSKLDDVNAPKISAHGLARLNDADVQEEEVDPAIQPKTEDGVLSGLHVSKYPVILDKIDHWWTADGLSDANMYIKTSSAWYILEGPSDAYRDSGEFRRFWVPHRLAQVITNYALKNPFASIQDFYRHLPTLSNEVEAMLGKPRTGGRQRQITDNDVELWKLSIRLDLQVLPPDILQSLEQTQIYQEFCQMSIEPTNQHFRSARSHRSPIITPTPPIFVSPLVHSIAQRYFRAILKRIGAEPQRFPINIQEQRFRIQKDRRLDVPSETVHEGGTVSTIEYYDSLVMDRRYFEVGDFVAVKPGTPRDPGIPLTDNKLVDTSWFGQIQRLYIKSGTYKDVGFAHVRWFTPGSATDLREFAAPNELFASYNTICSNIGLPTIRQRISVQLVDPKSTKIIPTRTLDRPGVPTPHFYCRFTHYDELGSFEDLNQPQVYDFLPKIDTKINRALKCADCNVSAHHQQTTGCISRVYDNPDGSPHTVLLLDEVYHQYDTVLFYEDDGQPQRGTRRQTVGRIEEWVFNARVGGPHTCKITKFGYFVDEKVSGFKTTSEDVLPKPLRRGRTLDERHLYYLEGSLIIVPIEDIVKRCVLRYQPHWQEHSNLDSEPSEFFVTHKKTRSGQFMPINPKEMITCEVCTLTSNVWDTYRLPYNMVAATGRMPQNAANYGAEVLPALDLCSGAGGLSQGLRKCGAFAVKWAVERDISAARSFRDNFPEAKVFTQDLNVCVANALDNSDNRNPVKSLDPDRPSMNMPAKGKVSAIFAGPPCPDFSLQNIHRSRAGESSTGLVLSVLSLIDFYRPRFFLIENVPGMLLHDMIDQDTGHIVLSGMVKLILRVLTTLGYSIRWSLFNTAHYGAPQSRTRLIFYGSRGGYRLPNIPVPSHFLPNNIKPRTTFARNDGVLSNSALYTPPGPIPAVNLAESIGDLPPFDWHVQNPISVAPPRQDGTVQIPSFDGQTPQGTGYAGFTDPTGYEANSPVSLYQARLRLGNTGRSVRYHFTKTFKTPRRGQPGKAERVVSVPLEPGADHRFIPPALTQNDWTHSHALSAAANTNWAPGRYGRLDWQGVFQTMITRIEPTAKQGRVLHPSQRRILTLQEAMRAQGFPDNFNFNGSATSICRQVGNAVPIPLGEAFGRVFRDAIICQVAWEKLGIKFPTDFLLEEADSSPNKAVLRLEGKLEGGESRMPDI